MTNVEGIASPVAATPSGRRTGRPRRILAGLFWFLTVVSLIWAVTVVWVHQVALNTDAYVRVMTRVMSDPEVIADASTDASNAVVNALGVQTRIASVLPQQAAFLAPAMTLAVSDALATRVERVLSNPDFQRVWANANRIVHAQAIAILRGGGDVVSTQGGQVVLNVFPLVDRILQDLQSSGFIPSSITLPDLSSPEAPEVLRQKLQSAVGVTLPPDFGTIPLIASDKLATAQQLVRAFDIVTVGSVVLTVLLALIAIWLSGNRRRMVVLLGLGALVALILARFLLRYGADQVAALALPGQVAGTVTLVLQDVLDDLFRLMLVVTLGAVAIAFVAYLLGRPRWVDQTAAAMRDVTGEPPPGTATAQPAAPEAAPGVDASPPAAPAAPKRSLRSQLGDHVDALRWLGVGLVAFLLVWRFAGLDDALLGALALGAWFLVVWMVTRPESTPGPPA